jgi:filamentous hemagglutinin
LENAARGNAFESQVINALGAAKNTTPVSVPGLGRAIPDVLGGGITEIKDVVNLSFTRQLRIEHAAAQGPFNLVVSPRTEYISGPLRSAVRESGGSIRVFDPATGTFRSWP